MSYTLFILMYFIDSKTKEIRRISMTNFEFFFAFSLIIFLKLK